MEMKMKNTVLLSKTKNDKIHQYFIDPACTKGEVFDCLSEWRLEVFQSIQEDMAREKPPEAPAAPATDIAPAAEAPATT